MNLLLEPPAPVPYFTDVGATLRALGTDTRQFEWFLSDIDTNRHPEGDALVGWWTGEALQELLAIADLQFNWGVYSAFKPGTHFDVGVLPSADGNERYWRAGPSLQPQLPGALFELVCWDSSATILVGIDAQQAASFIQRYPDAKPLAAVDMPQ